MKISKKHAMTVQTITGIIIAITFLATIIFGGIEIIEMWSTEDILWNVICSIGYPVVVFVMLKSIWKWVKHIVNQWKIYNGL